MSAFCYVWGSTDANWNEADWNWAECPIIGECVTWGTADVNWSLANMYWNGCSGSANPPPNPPTSSIVTTLYPGVDATTLVQPWIIEPWNPYRENRRAIIELSCKINGNRIKENKEVKKIKVSVRNTKISTKKENILLEFKPLKE